MANGRRGKGGGPAVSAKASGASCRGVRKPTAAAHADADALSDASEDFLPLNGDRRDDDSAEDEALMMRQMGLEGAEDAADEEDEEDDGSTEEESGDAGSDAEGEQEGSESAGSEFDGEEARTAWGHKAKDFYGESSSDESSDDDETLQLRATEAVRVTEVEDVEGMKEEHFGTDPRVLEGLRKLLDLQGKTLPGDATEEKERDVERGEQEVLWQARLDAEVGAILEGFSTSAGEQQKKQDGITAGMSEEELKKFVATAHPELQGLLQDLREALVEVKQKISPLIDLARSKKLLTKEGLSLFDTKNQLLLSYLSYLSYYVLLKTHGISIASHPVVERLIESRLLLQKIRPIEVALKPQLEKLLQMAREGPGAAFSTARPRLEAFAAVGESDEEDEEVASLDDDEGVPSSDGEERKDDQKYKAPKLLAVEYTGDKVSARTRAERELQRAAARLQKSELVRSVREVAGDAPEEIGVERWLAAKAHGLEAHEVGFTGSSGLNDDDDELDVVKRSLSKRERKAQAAKRALFERRSAAAVGSTLEDLEMFAEQPISLEEDAFDSVAGPLRRERSKGALSHYLNAAKQAADEEAKAQKANAEKLVLARQQKMHHLSRRNKETGRPTPRLATGDVEGDEEFESMAGKAREKKLEKKKRMQEKAKQFLPQLEEEVRGQRGVTREIEKNKGLTRKRKKFEGNARVHNRMKFQQKSKKLKSIRPDLRAVEDRNYEGEATGLRANLKKSRTLH